MKEMLKIVGYADKISVQPGEELKFMVSTSSQRYTASIVRLSGGMTGPDSTLPSEPIPASCAGEYPGRLQATYAGSYGELPLPEGWLEGGEFAVQLWIWPTAPTLGRPQTIWSARSADGKAGADLSLDEQGYLVFSLVDENAHTARIRTEVPVDAKTWYFVTAQYAKQGTATLTTARCEDWATIGEIQVADKAVNLDFTNVVVSRVLLAAESCWDAPRRTHRHYNGKIENPRFFRSILDAKQQQALLAGSEEPATLVGDKLVADYDFGVEISSARLVDRSEGGHHGILRQAPTRAVTSHAWTGEHLDFRSAPKHYAAAHFHDDDIENAGWEPDITWRLPNDLPSSVYALRLEAEEEIDYIPFFVRPAADAVKASILFLAPTNTYLAYANERLFELELQDFMGHELRLAKQDQYLLEHPEMGKSIYDTHRDGSGVHYSSRLRPVMNMRPHYRNWLNGGMRHLAADLYITGWLEKRGHHFDVATDEDLDKEGFKLLQSYSVLVTGTHPEYWTRPMLKALKQYLNNGGRLMYLGANGFYWVTSLDPERPHLIEVRRGNAGTRSWDSPPGELYHSTTGESGGMWRHHGYVPQQLVGIGFTAQGWGPGCGYRRLKDSFHPEVKFIFDGVGEEELIGDFGYVMGGAVGDEVDRFDPALGSPRQTWWLATSTGLDDRYQLVHEDQLLTTPGQGGTENPLVRADMTYFEIKGGGAVFSVGSINWAGSMAWNEYDNNVARISDNILNHFLEKSSGHQGTKRRST